MIKIIEHLKNDPQVSDYKVNAHRKESYELFFVKGKLETVRCTDNTDKEVTVYVRHGEFMGDSTFFVYTSTTEQQLKELIGEAVQKALLINNPAYTLPEGQTGTYEVKSNISEEEMTDVARQVAEAVFEANSRENCALNSVEVFINRHTEQVMNSRGLDKKQVRYDAMLETIPTYNGSDRSVELYHQYNFGAMDQGRIKQEILQKLMEVQGRYEAQTPEKLCTDQVLLNIQEVATLYMEYAYDLNYGSVYSHSNLFKKGEAIQKEPAGDLLGVTMAGQAEGCVRSAQFDSDGMALGSVRLIDQGKALNYFGSNRYGQYLNEQPTGMLSCLCADAGTLDETQLQEEYLEVVSMSGLQVDLYNDYIGGEVRLAYLHSQGEVTPVTGISISGTLSQVMESIRFSKNTGIYNGYVGPEKALLSNMKIY